MSETFNGWIIVPREIYNEVKGTLAKYIVLEREYGKAIDVSVRNLPKEIFDSICNMPGIINQCK